MPRIGLQTLRGTGLTSICNDASITATNSIKENQADWFESCRFCVADEST